VSPPAGRRSVRVSPPRFLLELDGVECGLLASSMGGDATADVVPEDGPPAFVPKRLGTVRYEPITISFGLGLAPVLYEWIAAWWSGKHVRKSGEIKTLGANQKVTRELAFDDASIMRADLPELDAASKDLGTISLTLAARRTAAAKGTGQAKVALAKPQKAWRTSNFRLEIDDLDCSRVSKIGGVAVPGRAPTDFPHLELALSAVSAESWFDWHEDFVVNGQNDEAHERSGELRFMAADGTSELGRVKLHNLGIYRIAPEPQPDGASSPSRLRASLYCERMELEVPIA
jgi:hypothetical protein